MRILLFQEDFNESLSYLVPAVMSREDVISYLKVVEQEIVEKYKANQTVGSFLYILQYLFLIEIRGA